MREDLDAARDLLADRAAEKLSTAPEETAPEEREPSLPRLGVLGWLRLVWRQLTSMRVALILLFLLALGAVPGSLLPQRSIDRPKVAAYFEQHPDLAPLLDRLQLFDVYRSVWFSAIYLLLFVSLLGCIVPRTRQHWKAMRARPPAAPRNLGKLPSYRRWETDTAPEQVLAAASRVLKGARFRTVAAGGAVSAEKGYARETGNLLFHVSLLGVLVGVALGSLYGFSGAKLVVEGDGFANTPVSYDDFTPGRLFRLDALSPFSFKLDRFAASYQTSGPQQGQPRSFDAYVTYKKSPDAPQQRYDIRVNHPLSIDGTKVFLSGNGYAPVFTVRDGTGQVVFSGPVPFLPQDGNNTSTGVLKVPDAKPHGLGFQGFFLPTAVIHPERGPVSAFPDAVNPVVFLTAWKGDDGSNSGLPQSAFRLNTEKMQQVTEGGEPVRMALRQGETKTLPDGLGSITYQGYKRYAYFSVSRDPGESVALASVAVALAGLLLSLFVRRRRVWVRASTGADGRTVVEVAGLARTEDGDLGDEMDRLAERLRESAPGWEGKPG